MADEVKVDLDSIAEMQTILEKLMSTMSDAEGMTGAKDMIAALASKIGDLTSNAPAAAAAIGILGASVKELNLAKNISEMYKGFASNIQALGGRAAAAGVDVGNLAISVMTLGALASGKFGMSDELQKMGKDAQGAAAQLGDIGAGLVKFMPKGMFATATQNILNQVGATTNLESALMRAAAQAGQLDEIVGSGLDTENIINLSDLTSRYIDITTRLGTANNLTSGQAAKYVEALRQIPGTLGDVIKVGGGIGAITAENAILKVATGTGQSHEDVIKDLTFAYENWGKTGEKALPLVVKLSAAVQKLGIPMKFMRTYAHGVGEQFKFLGDNTKGAIDIMMRMGPALKASGLGPAAMTELVSNMTSGVAKMDLAQRAFVSAQSGGPGGLQGGYEIALAMREGRTEDVFSKVEDTLRNMFAGQVVTLEEAATDSSAAAQFTKQVQMLTSGPMKIAGSEAEAFHILEAMASGKVFTGEPAAETPEDLLSTAVMRGEKIQVQQYTKLVDIHNTMVKIGSMGAVQGTEAIRATNKLLMPEGAAVEMREKAGPVGAPGATEKFGGSYAENKLTVEKAQKVKQEMVAVGKSIIRGTGAPGFDITKTDEAGAAKKKSPTAPRAAVAGDLERAAEAEKESAGRGSPERAGPTGTVIVKVMEKDTVLNLIRAIVDPLNDKIEVLEDNNLPGN